MEKKVRFILLLLTQAAMASADPQIICPSEPVEATVSQDVTLHCHLVPPLDATNMTVEWRNETQKHNIHLFQGGRRSLFSEGLTKGNLSMKISSVQLFDSGRYRCSVTSENLQHSCYVNLTVGQTNTGLIIRISFAVVFVIIVLFALACCCRARTTGGMDDCLKLPLGICLCVFEILQNVN